MSYTVTLQPSGRQFSCTSQQAILGAGLNAGAGLPFSCRSGVCRSCRGRVATGQVDLGNVHPAYLSEEERAQGYAHLCQAKPLSDCTIEIDEYDTSLSHPIQQLPSRVLSITRMAPDVIALTLGLPPNEPLRFHAGQYLDIVFDDALRRSYSIANAPAADGVRQVELHLRHMPGGAFTDKAFSTLKVREMLRIEAPLGQFFLDQKSDKPVVLLASGTGFAPIKAMVEYGIAQKSKRPMHIYWGGRTRADLYLHELALQWARDHAYIRYTPVLSNATADCCWDGRDGFVHRAVMQDYPDLTDHQVYACGAPIVVESARRDFIGACHLPDHEFRADAFVSEADKASPALDIKD
ncbi:CDP-6-deoxy-delta-3,4-glucoseen reductase [Eoetvoesiella caeni]|uniref:CDP-4-dehydro-6-deoxyglucose reductase n=1 Tax=Eoetvoesiella caeni TaxID=645616 RepID=A0A366H928_9BURK|nr:CDP-6-deoxy-delta-3,4-glucoseen reductase [Eoetvoesiella caeni]MCI2809842.1 CDP-6-deoxy-delta-3,4-glucoseen reductase [Eoetvoesiella caeni]NYT56243.1 CDP-6-deoxy-delta-3,4-glucoseen reductase [Eoetvoesiella caeni]RBP38300.1 CDP-4-dehydro-6-deoxyglucose reductase [Eoetvoesiella caeni]